MANLGKTLAELMQGQQQMQQPLPMMPQQQMMMPMQLDPYGQQQSGLSQALMRGIGYGRP
jgi:hypothetical protein